MLITVQNSAPTLAPYTEESTMKRLWLSLFTSTAVGLVSLTSCAASPNMTEATAPAAAPTADQSLAQSQTEKSQGDMAADKATSAETDASNTTNATAQKPQLIKRANLSLTVESIDDSFSQVREIVQAQQGDILSLQDEGNSPQERLRYVTFELRVPQAKLDATVEALTQVGTVVDQSLSTEDVSTQLVDLQARLSNARKSEEALRELMERSGAITDVLQVSRELSTVRENIEKMAAQQKNLQTQVSYSTISLRIESAIARSPEQPALSRQLGNTWDSATHSVGSVTTGLLKTGLWLLAYSPYIAIFLGIAVVTNKVRRRTVRNG
jgi:hypothetical protein